MASSLTGKAAEVPAFAVQLSRLKPVQLTREPTDPLISIWWSPSCSIRNLHSMARCEWMRCTSRMPDAKSLYDCLVAENPVLSEKRATMNIRSVQQVLLPSQIRWVPTHLMIADGLTKYDQKLQNVLRTWCNDPVVQLKEIKNSNSTKETKTSEKHSLVTVFGLHSADRLNPAWLRSQCDFGPTPISRRPQSLFSNRNGKQAAAILCPFCNLPLLDRADRNHPSVAIARNLLWYNEELKD